MKTIHTILVDAENVAAAKHAIDKLIRKAHRYGCTDISYSLRDVSQKEAVRIGDHEFHADRDCIAFDVTGEAPRVGEFEFMARIERLEGGNVVDCVPGIEADPNWRAADGSCGHCGKRRSRRLLFVVRDTAGVASIVGRSCLRDYLGADAPETILRRFSIFRELRGLEPSEFGGSGGRARIPTMMVLSWSMLAIRLDGWTSRAKANELNERFGTESYYPTSSTVSFLMFPPRTAEGREEWEALAKKLSNQDISDAQDALSWVLASQDSSEYMSNLRAVMSSDFIDPKRLGLVASAAASYLRAHDRLGTRKGSEQAPKVDAPLGRHEVEAEIISVRTEETQYGWSTKALYVVSTDSGQWRFWGTVPRSILDTKHDRELSLEGLKVRVKATFQPKADDPSFAFATRPSGSIIE